MAIVDIELIKQYLENDNVASVIYNGVAVNSLVLDGEKIWYPCYKGHLAYSSVVIPPTCTTQGYTTHTCHRCGESYKDTFTDAPGHIESDWIVDKEATNKEEGSKHKECTVCGTVLRTEDIPKRDALTYTLLADGTYSVKRAYDNIIGEIIIPSTYNGKPVTEVADDAFFNCDNITGVYLPDTITRIGNRAFCGCAALSEIVLGTGVTYIGTWAFRYSYNFNEITIPESVTYIGGQAFEYCAEGLLIYCEASSKPSGWHSSWNPDNLDVIWGCDRYEYTLLGDGTYSIKAKVGAAIPNDVIIPSTAYGRVVTHIGEDAFSGYTDIISVTIPDSITSIGDYAFANCSMLGTVNIGENSQLTSIGKEAFYEVTEIVTMFLPDSLTTIGDSAFALSSIETLAIPDNVTSIGFECFRDSNLRTITFGANSKLSYLGGYAFTDCSLLTSIELPDGVTDIEERTFYGCSNLGTVTFGNNLERIWDRAFAYSGLTTVTIPEGCWSISDGAFSNCTGLSTINLPSTLRSVGEESASSVFNNTAYYNNPNNWTDGVLYIGEWLIDIKSTVTEVEVASSCNSVGAGAISGWTHMAAIKIPLSVTNIQPKAFTGSENLTIYCEASSKPKGWKENWCDDSVTVVWGYVEDTNIYLVTESGEYLTDEQGNLLIL